VFLFELLKGYWILFPEEPSEEKIDAEIKEQIDQMAAEDSEMQAALEPDDPEFGNFAIFN